MSFLLILLKISLVTGTGLLAVRLARRRRASIRHALLTATFAAAILIPLVTLAGPAICIIVPFVADEPPAAPPSTVAAANAGHAESGQADLPGAFTSNETTPPAFPWRETLTGLWAIGAAIFCWPVLAGALRVRSLRRSSLPWPQERRFADPLGSAADESMRRNVVLLLHPSLHGPVTWGVLRPIIVLPADARTWPEADLERALIHEFEHIRRHDWLTERVARVTCAIYWFHPFMWAVWRSLALEAERACDDAVIGRGEPAAYADQLLRLAERQAASGKPSALLAMTGRHDLARRIHAVLDRHQRRGRTGVVAAGLISLGATAVIAASAPIQFVPLAVWAPAASTRPRPSQTDPPSSPTDTGIRREVRMPKRSLPVALTALTIGLATQPAPARAQEPVFTVKDMYYAPANGLTAETDEDFIKHAYRFCTIQIQTARLAIKTTSHPDVKAFAERLVTNHTAMAKSLTEWATKKNVVLKDDDPAVKMKLDKHKPLDALTGTVFDRAFLAAIMDDQVDGIHLVSNEKRNTKDAGLSAFAEETRLTLLAHMNAARPLRAKLQLTAQQR